MRQLVLDLEESLIRQVANAGMGRSDVLKFWFGESDEVTPAFIREAAAESLARGETFYSHNLGLAELRETIASYCSGLRCEGAAPVSADRITATSGGVNALMLAVQALVNAGDHVVAVTPVWPNLTAQPAIMGGRVQCVSLKPAAGQWKLDMDELLAAITPATRLLIVNSPNNPTGWTLTRGEQEVILAHCRRTGTWILADEVYERLYFENLPDGPAPGRPKPDAPLVGEGRSPSGDSHVCAPSFLDIATPEDRLMVAHSFSKSFLMTGWRLGWLVLPASVTTHMGKLVEFNTSCAPVFIQRAGVVALQRTDEVTPQVVAHLKKCRDTLIPLLQGVPGVQVAAAPGGMYAFFRLAGQGDSFDIAKRLVVEAGLGLAPGNAFTSDPSPELQGWLRWCFASQDLGRLRAGVDRLAGWLGRQ
ncbi:pyridoxal phosphate-dependent aminotransferase [Polaromonas sp.]|uniref:pyridoxal phosphate-dependent aminotransferase n=1 Tax=Polaromonas sp. TaxID=1869339 RepID=UPI0039C9EA57